MNMTPTNHIIEELDKQITQLQIFRNWVLEHRAVLDSSGDNQPFLYGVNLHLFLHQEPKVVKPLARAIGGVWIRDKNTDGGHDWKQTVCGCAIFLRNAEPKKQEPVRDDIVDLSEPGPLPPEGQAATAEEAAIVSRLIDPFDRTDETDAERKERFATEKADHDNDLAKSNSL